MHSSQPHKLNPKPKLNVDNIFNPGKIDQLIKSNNANIKNNKSSNIKKIIAIIILIGISIITIKYMLYDNINNYINDTMCTDKLKNAGYVQELSSNRRDRYKYTGTDPAKPDLRDGSWYNMKDDFGCSVREEENYLFLGIVIIIITVFTTGILIDSIILNKSKNKKILIKNNELLNRKNYLEDPSNNLEINQQKEKEKEKEIEKLEKEHAEKLAEINKQNN